MTHTLRLVALLLMAAVADAAEGEEVAEPDSVAAAPAVTAPVDSLAMAAGERPDSVAARPKPRSSTYWIKQLWDNGFHINEPDVEYPKFPRFALNVYNWGNRVFNSYDSTYVVGTGKNWKLQAKSFNWLETITMQFPEREINMHTHFYADAGVYISFMAVSVGYMFNVNELLGTRTHRATFTFDFTCSRFTLNLVQQSYSGDMTITQLGSYNGGHHVSVPFDGGSVNSLNFDAYYFFNHNRYSHAAAYAYSKYQRKSAGSALAGFSYATKSINLNLQELDLDVGEEMQQYMRPYYFHYSDYQLMGGYGYNWAILPNRWVLNATGLLSMGYRRSYEDASEGKRDMIANGFRVKLGATYNHRALFVALAASGRGGIFYTSNFLFFNANFNFGVNVGMRF